jgi:hypothetical protein
VNIVIDENGGLEADEDVDVFESSETTSSPEQKSRWAELPPSSTLSVTQADKFLCWRNAAIVSIIGERNGGKTTLVTELYGCFMRGSFAGNLFCQSLSLLEFEKKSFQSRVDSGRIYPDTLRTSVQDGLRFFHLAVSDESKLKRRDLLISERAGEDYRKIRDRPEQASEMVELRKASSVVLIIDGERVALPLKRHEVYASVRNIVRVLIDTQNISTNAHIQLVITKYDLLSGDDLSEARDSLHEFEKSISVLIAGRFEVSVYRTAARDPTPGSAPAQGLEPLLQSWLRPSSEVSVKYIPMPELTCEFDRMMLKRVDA